MFARQFVRLVTLLLCHTCAQAESLEGTWVTILHPSGLVYPHIEELRIDRDGGFSATIYGRREGPGCEESARTSSCSPGKTNVKGQIDVDLRQGVVTAKSSVLIPGAMRGIGNATDGRIAQELLWFGLGEPWSIRREARVLVMTRISRPRIDGTNFDGTRDVATEKYFYKVDPEFAHDLVAFAASFDYSLVKLSCIIGVVSDDSERSHSFRALIRDLITVSQKRNELLASVQKNPTPELRQILLQVLSTLGTVTGAPTNDDVSAAARALGVSAEQVERYIREAVTPHRAGFDVLLFSMLRPLEPEIRACHKKYFG
jgi:hypothetical protein